MTKEEQHAKELEKLEKARTDHIIDQVQYQKIKLDLEKKYQESVQQADIIHSAQEMYDHIQSAIANRVLSEGPKDERSSARRAFYGAPASIQRGIISGEISGTVLSDGTIQDRMNNFNSLPASKQREWINGGNNPMSPGLEKIENNTKTTNDKLDRVIDAIKNINTGLN
jgi:hypothetical protein